MLNGIFRKFIGKGGDGDTSKDVAKKRLKFALVYDRLDVSDDVLEDLQRDIVEVISRYFEIDKDGLSLDIRESGDLSALVLNTPILSKRREIS